ncbi:MAG: BON domain-containing protein [Thermoguttaceae bacterium]
MDHLTYGTTPVLPSSEVRRHLLPATPADSEKLAALIERAVRRETGGGVEDLHVEVGRNSVVLYGRCGTFYTKQKAQHAAMEVSSGRQLTNCIEVS